MDALLPRTKLFIYSPSPLTVASQLRIIPRLFSSLGYSRISRSFLGPPCFFLGTFRSKMRRKVREKERERERNAERNQDFRVVDAIKATPCSERITFLLFDRWRWDPFQRELLSEDDWCSAECFTVGKARGHIRTVSSAYIERLFAEKLDHEVDQRATRFSLPLICSGSPSRSLRRPALLNATCPRGRSISSLSYRAWLVQLHFPMVARSADAWFLAAMVRTEDVEVRGETY